MGRCYGANTSEKLARRATRATTTRAREISAGIYSGAFISDVEHKTVVEVNKTGTVAVGVTSVGIGRAAVQDPVNLAINHPFFYAIRDNMTGDLLFVGVLMNPGAG